MPKDFISININAKQISSWLNDVEKKELPFITAMTLTYTAKDAQAELTKQIPLQLREPTPFTRKGTGITPAKKTRLVSTVFIKDKQEDYLIYQVEGGTRKPRNRVMLTPGGNLKTNKYGNIPRTRMKTLTGKQNVFVGKPKGRNLPSGVWSRHPAKNSKRIKPEVIFINSATYKQKLDFFGIVRDEAQSKAQTNFTRSFRRVLDK